jgi:ATP-dependent Clp protease ATP-binding subunit ClpC
VQNPVIDSYARFRVSFAISSSPVMFERYNEKARRVVFFARYEANLAGSPYIETEHLLLGICRNRLLITRILGSDESREKLEQKLRHQRPKGGSTSVDLPLSNESQRVLAYAAEEAERLSHRHIGVEHLLLGLLREKGCEASHVLMECGFTIERGRAIAGEVSEAETPNSTP